MNEFIEIEVLTELGIIYNAGEYIEKFINEDFLLIHTWWANRTN